MAGRSAVFLRISRCAGGIAGKRNPVMPDGWCCIFTDFTLCGRNRGAKRNFVMSYAEYSGIAENRNSAVDVECRVLTASKMF